MALLKPLLLSPGVKIYLWWNSIDLKQVYTKEESNSMPPGNETWYSLCANFSLQIHLSYDLQPKELQFFLSLATEDEIISLPWKGMYLFPVFSLHYSITSSKIIESYKHISVEGAYTRKICRNSIQFSCENSNCFSNSRCFLLRYPRITFGNAGCGVLQYVKSNL